MEYHFPFGQVLRSLVQQDRSKKEIFVLGVYASAVHAKWIKDGRVICPALAVASEPRIFWDGNKSEAEEIIEKISIPKELGRLEPAGKNLNGPSAEVLKNNILAPLGYKMSDAWLCDLLPQTRLNEGQQRVIREKYAPLVEKYSLNNVTIPKRPTLFCDEKRAEEISLELMESGAELLVLLGDIPIAQYLKRVADISFSTLSEYTELYGYGNTVEVSIMGKCIKVLPLAHPRQIGGLGTHSEKWRNTHINWQNSRS